MVGFGAAQQFRDEPLAQVHETGWNWCPGLPLGLVVLSTLLSTLLAIVGSSSMYRPVSVVALGMVTLFSAAWLWQGSPFPEPTDDCTPDTGAMLTTMGGIVLVSALLWMFQGGGRVQPVLQ